MMAGCGTMILGSDSHTRYGALGTMAVGEGGAGACQAASAATPTTSPMPEVVARLSDGQAPPAASARRTWRIALVQAHLRQRLCQKQACWSSPAPASPACPIDYRNGIDVMTTETTCLSSIWQTDEETKSYL